MAIHWYGHQTISTVRQVMWNRITAAAIDLQNYARKKTSILNPRYRKSMPTPRRRTSRPTPGSAKSKTLRMRYPYLRTGHLRRNIATEFSPRGIENPWSRVGTNVSYGKDLELGFNNSFTGTWVRYPWLSLAWTERRAVTRRIIESGRLGTP